MSPTAVLAGNKLQTYEYRTEAINNVSMGDINIELEEYTLDENGNEIPFPDIATVIPGDDLAKIVRIHNVAQDAWIRIKLDFASDDGLTGVDESMVLFTNPDEWKKVGDYYYALKPIMHDTTVEFMKGLHIPEWWTETDAEKRFTLTVNADAVQLRNFTPDFDSDDPWFGTMIEHCVHNSYELPVVPGNTNFLVEFRGGAEGFIRTGDDFFSNWTELMPGDTMTGKVKIRNKYKKGIELYFQTQNLKGAELLKQLDLTITSTDGTVIYDGKMDKPLTKGILLGEYPTGTEGYMNYTVHVPEELTNKYALLSSRVKWIYTTKISEKVKKPTVTPEPGKPTDPVKGGVKTGDTHDAVPYLALALAAALMIAVALRRKKGGAER